MVYRQIHPGFYGSGHVWGPVIRHIHSLVPSVPIVKMGTHRLVCNGPRLWPHVENCLDQCIPWPYCWCSVSVRPFLPWLPSATLSPLRPESLLPSVGGKPSVVAPVPGTAGSPASIWQTMKTAATIRQSIQLGLTHKRKNNNTDIRLNFKLCKKMAL